MRANSGCLMMVVNPAGTAIYAAQEALRSLHPELRGPQIQCAAVHATIIEYVNRVCSVPRPGDEFGGE